MIGSPFSPSATRLLLLGAGELGKEMAISAQRLGIEVVAVDHYEHAPAMQVAHRSHVISMEDADALRKIIEIENPHYIVPEVEAIATKTLVELESEGFNVVPTANATHLTMNREGIRRLAAEELSLLTSPYQFASTYDEFLQAIAEVGFPCFVKPTMSSSGKGQSLVGNEEDISSAWHDAMAGARGQSGGVIVEGKVDFDYEITLLTVRHCAGTSFCEPIGHRQEKGDYRESWQPQPMSEKVLQAAQAMAKTITDALGGRGLFGVELFIKGQTVYFSEVSPRPHDTGMVTLISQSLSEFDLHLRAILGFPIPNILFHGPAASHVILKKGHSTNMIFDHLADALGLPDTDIRLFGKPDIRGIRRLGVALALGSSIDEAKEKAEQTASKISIQFVS